MKKKTGLVWGVVLLFCAAGVTQTAAPAPVTVIRAGILIDPRVDAPRRNQVIVIRGERVEAVGDAGTVKQPAGANVIDLSNATVLPGMIESHTHLFLQGEDPAKGGYDVQLLKFYPSYRAARATVSARRALEQGFTTIRDMETEGAGYGDVGIKQAVDEGIIPGPRIFTTTRGISTTGGYPLEGYAPGVAVPKGVQIVDGPVEARKATREQLDYGADWIKVYMTHRSWVDKDGKLVSQPTLTVEELKAIVDEAHGWGHKVACHAYSGDGLHRALDGGCDSIEHGLLLDDAAIVQMKKQGTWYCPTLSVYYTDWSPEGTPDGKRDRARALVHEQSFRKALQAELKIVFGTDIGGIPWTEPIAPEFGLMTKFGMTPLEAIRSATVRPAEMLGMPGEIGVVAPGAYADVIAVRGNPVSDIDELGRVIFVMKNGRVFSDSSGGPVTIESTTRK
jgi:imidazolonepropionase-like amidohydrolase